MAIETQVITGLKSDFESLLNGELGNGNGWMLTANSFVVTLNDDQEAIYYTLLFRDIPE